jgi:hypothetical protein
MNPSERSKPFAMDFLHAGTLLLIFLSGSYTAFVSQAASADYRRLYWNIFPVALIHFTMAIAYFMKVRHWTRWVVACLFLIAFGFLGEMTFRVWH